jgi:two-component system cell cycle response regulator
MSIGSDTKQDIKPGDIPEDEDTQDTSQIDLEPLAKSLHSVTKEGKQPCLVVLRGTDVGKIIPLGTEPITIGRGAECTTVMQDESISRVHVEVQINESGQVVAHDMESTNGIFVDGQKVDETILKADDKLLLGRRTLLKLMFQDQIEQLYQQEIYQSSTRDALTGIYNRRFLDERMTGDLSLARRHRDPFSFLMFDIDHFKDVNDKYGHQSGDEALVVISAAVKNIIRTEDVFGRYGGEEFAIIAPQIALEGARILGERIRQCIADEKIQGQDSSETIIQLTVSVGVVTVHPNAVAEAITVVSVADDNLYRAKQGGRDQVVSSMIK